MSEMVERVARAIATELGADLDTAFANKTEWTNMRGTDAAGRWRDINEPFKSDYLAAARAAIEAMRSQTLVYRDNGHVVHEMRGAPDDIWKTLLDAALGEGE